MLILFLPNVDNNACFFCLNFYKEDQTTLLRGFETVFKLHLELEGLRSRFDEAKSQDAERLENLIKPLSIAIKKLEDTVSFILETARAHNTLMGKEHLNEQFPLKKDITMEELQKLFDQAG